MKKKNKTKYHVASEILHYKWKDRCIDLSTDELIEITEGMITEITEGMTNRANFSVHLVKTE